VRKIFDAAQNTWRVDSPDTALDAKALVQMEQANSARHEERYGNLTPRFAAQLEKAPGRRERMLRVVLRHEDIHPLNRTEHTRDEMKSAAARRAKLLADKAVEAPGLASALAVRHGLIIDSVGGHIIRCRSEKDLEGVVSLAKDELVACVEEYVEYGPTADSYHDIPPSAYNPAMTGRGSPSIPIATFEGGITDGFLQCVGLWPRPNGVDSPPSSNPNQHSEMTWQVMRITAPSCTHLHRLSTDYVLAASQQWITDNEVRVLSLSHTRDNDPLGYEARVMDYFSYVWPFPVFCNPAGNNGYNEVANWGAYNSLSVGNVQHYQHATYRLNGCTQTSNPPQRYGGIDDREMPYLVAPGYAPNNPEPWSDRCLMDSWCGTSISAPLLNGICGILRATTIDGVLWNDSWPELLRAILLLTAQNVDASEWDRNEDGRDGAGVVSGAAAEAFCSEAVVNPWGTAPSTGALNGHLNPSSTGDYSVSVQMPTTFPAGKHLRVVMVWDSNPSTTQVRNDLTDVDIWTYTDAGLRYSAAWNSSIEMMDLYPNELTPGQTYTLYFHQTVPRIPAGEFTYYSLAWAWVRDHAN